MRVVKLLLVVCLLAAAATAVDVGSARKCTPLASISSLMFTQTLTANRERTANVPLLQCFGSCPSEAVLLGAHCMQQGLNDAGLPTWRCNPNFAPSGQRNVRYGLSNVRVECEGCSGSGDSNVAQGTCSLYYSVSTQTRAVRNNQHHSHYEGGGATAFELLFFIAVISLCCLWRVGWCCNNQSPEYGVQTTPAYGVPVQNGNTVYNNYGGGFGGSGFGTGMLTGYIIGDALSHRGGYGGGYGDYGGGGDEGGGGWSGGGWGGSDGGGYGGSDSI